MTPTERRDCLDAIGWSQREFARQIGIDESTVRRWFRDGPGEPAADVDEWLARVAQYHRQNPAPASSRV